MAVAVLQSSLVRRTLLELVHLHEARRTRASQHAKKTTTNVADIALKFAEDGCYACRGLLLTVCRSAQLNAARPHRSEPRRTRQWRRRQRRAWAGHSSRNGQGTTVVATAKCWCSVSEGNRQGKATSCMPVSCAVAPAARITSTCGVIVRTLLLSFNLSIFQSFNLSIFQSFNLRFTLQVL